MKKIYLYFKELFLDIRELMYSRRQARIFKKNGVKEYTNEF